MSPKTNVLLTILCAAVGLGGPTLAEDEDPVAAAVEDPAVSAVEADTNESPLSTLDWLVGSWVGERDQRSIEFSCHFTKNNAFLIRSFRVLDGSDVAMSGMQLIAWDPAQQVIRSWTYDSDGGFGNDVWSQAGNRYTMRSKYTLPDGGTGSALNIMKYINDDTFSWQSTHREIDGELQPDTAEIIVSRVAVPESASIENGDGEQN